jgi:TPP-dependent indolepyruvate ferredoxin oxidoreductase alpha subunit
LGLGLALAQPERGGIAVNGDGCMLVNLNTFVTIGSNLANLFLIVLDNGICMVTGGQPMAGAVDAWTSPPWRELPVFMGSIPSINTVSGEAMQRTLCQKKVQLSFG